jgi:hypothetical protein
MRDQFGFGDNGCCNLPPFGLLCLKRAYPDQ